MDSTARAVGLGLAVLAALPLQAAAGGKCEFENEPLFPGYYWDENCSMGDVGCKADGKEPPFCRFCGGGEYTNPCPYTSCHFPGGEPGVPYYWEYDCQLGMLGCWADGVHEKCRFCGEAPFESVPCPENRSKPPRSRACQFKGEPEVPFYYWDKMCHKGMHGCNADGEREQCRYCGSGPYADIPCPPSEVCSFRSEPSTPYYWDPNCTKGMIGCLADGVHEQCRFCAKRPFQDVPCPPSVAPPGGNCSFPEKSQPTIPYYWEPTCREGILGCWADGLHKECRFCGVGVFESVPCPGYASPTAPPLAPAPTPAVGGAPDAGGAPAAGVAEGGGSDGAAADGPPQEAGPQLGAAEEAVGATGGGEAPPASGAGLAAGVAAAYGGVGGQAARAQGGEEGHAEGGKQKDIHADEIVEEISGAPRAAGALGLAALLASWAA